MIPVGERRVVIIDFKFDFVSFYTGVTFEVAVNSGEEGTLCGCVCGCVFDEEHEDMHVLRHEGMNYAEDYHGYWIKRRVIEEKTEKINREPDWEV